MPIGNALTLAKEERICSRTLIDKLFMGGKSKSMTAFPLRVVYLVQEADESLMPQVQMMVSVPKRCFKRAVRRNRVKRQVREAYRKHKHTLFAQLAATPGRSIAVAFIWLDAQLHDSETVEKRVGQLLERIGERL